MLLHYLVNACSASCTWNRWPSAKKHQTLFRRTCGIQISQIRTQSSTRSGLSCNIVSTRQKSVACEWWVIDVWCGLEQSNINMAIDHQHRRLQACICLEGGQFEHNLWTNNINFVSIYQFQCNFCMTVTVSHLSFKKCACNVDN